MKRSCTGNFTLYDAVLFFVFLLIASSIIGYYGNHTSDIYTERNLSSDFCDDARKAILSSTVNETSFNSSSGVVIKEDESIRNLLIEQMYLEKHDIERDNFSFSDDIVDLVNNHIKSKIWIIKVISEGTDDLVLWKKGEIDPDIEISKILGHDFVASTFKEDGIEGDVEISLYLSN